MPPLTEALGIPGAHAVSLLDPDGSKVLWWAGETAPTEQEAAATVTLAAASAGLVLLGGNGADELSDILLTSADAFHVVRLVGEEAPLVAHLTLRRAGANLAMARREFGSIITSYARQVVRPQPSSTFDPTAREVGNGTVDLSASVTPPPGFRSAGFSPGFAPAGAEPLGSGPAHGFGPADADRLGFGAADTESLGLGPAEPGPAGSPAGLPRRNRLDPPEPEEGSDLLSLLGRPYVTDDHVLDRVLVGLRQL
ncbi:hypothetical protein [Paractinoplanes maris]|uniref:hypothetical protein n=1 Tax=Paractinoplanes maris TaxID=1734446 RepID=UPI002021C094|nr:hypothetical protein [Actinoplanes maris]